MLKPNTNTNAIEFSTVAEAASRKWSSLSNLTFASSIEGRPNAFLNIFADHVSGNAFTVFVEQLRLLPSQVRWFRQRGWHLALLSGAGFIGMRRAVCIRFKLENAGQVFHATTRKSFERIQREGLKTCFAAQLPDDGHRLEAEHHIHVSTSLGESRLWANDCNLLAHEKAGFDRSSVILEYALTDSGINFYRDPFSETGWILSADFVPRRLFVRHVLANDHCDARTES